MDAQRVQNGCSDTVAHSYISLGSHKVAAHKRTSCYSYAAIINVTFEFYALMYELNAIKLMTVNCALMAVTFGVIKMIYGMDKTSNFL